MLPLETALSFFGIAVLLSLSPGPDNVFVMTLSALRGVRAGLWVVLGLCSGLIVHTLAVAFGVAALLAACFSLPGGVLRAIGGMLSDKYGAHSVTWWVMWVSWICLFLLSYPQTDFTIATVNGPKTFHIGLNVYVFTGIMFLLGICWAFGKASVFKYISDDYPQNIGTISGIVGLAGGMGGFVLPIMFGALMDLTGIRSSAFMLMYGVVWVSLIWMYFTEVRNTRLMGSQSAVAQTATR